MRKNSNLREKVLRYLSRELAKGNLAPGSYINQNEICKKLDVSRAPLRDALIQLEKDNFVRIQARRGVLVNKLTLADVKQAYELIGALESSVISSEFDKFRPSHIDRMTALNVELYDALAKGYFDRYFELNINFHNIFLEVSDNDLLKQIIGPIKKRLYGFPLMAYDEEWERVNLVEHERLIYSIQAGNREAATSIVQFEHWSFARHEKHLIKIYGFDKNGA
jgi:DNA-binding GntR family transcriptional regulator